MDRWKEYGTELFKRPIDESPHKEDKVPIMEQEPVPLLSEVEHAVKKLRAGKSPGIDGIPAELVKAIQDHMVSNFSTNCVQAFGLLGIGQMNGRYRNFLFCLNLGIENCAQTTGLLPLSVTPAKSYS